MGYLRKDKAKTPKWPITILYDDRERKPWNFHEPRFFVFKRVRLKTADYTILGYENKIAIEKKADLHEFITDISGKYRNTFKRFLERLSTYPTKCIVIEDSFSNIDKVIRTIKGTAITPESVYYWVTLITIKYKIPVLFIGKGKQSKKQLLINLFTRLIKHSI